MIIKTADPVLHETTDSLMKSDLFEIYLSNDQKNNKDLDIELLRRLNKEIMREGDEQYTYANED